MTRRYRLFAGLLASLSMTVSFAEAVWASTCVPGPRMHPVSVVDSVGEGPGDSKGGADRGRALHDGDDSEHGQECPFGSSLASQACTGLTALASQPSPVPTLSADVASEGSTLHPLSDLLLPHVPFHPPRA